MSKALAQDRHHRPQQESDRRTLAGKITRVLITVAASLAPALQTTGAQVDQGVPTTPVISERGPHHRVWSKVNVTTNDAGRIRTNVSSFVELGSGMHRWSAESNQWIDAEAVIEIEGNTAVARKGAHQVTFAANANTAGAIDLVAPDGKRFRSHVLGIAFFDAATGRSVMIGTLKDSIGELHSSNIVIYPDAFDGLQADIRYTYRLGGFEQDVILRENPALPDGYPPDTSRLEVWTEFIEAPGGFLTQRGISGMTDDTLDFGALQTGAGRAFSLGDEPNPRSSVPVAKRWLTVEGRTCLVEAVRYNAVKRELDKLPPPGGQAGLKPRNANAHLAGAAQPHAGDRPFPAAPRARAENPGSKFRTAAVTSATGGENVGSAVLTNAAVLPSTLRGTDRTVRGAVTNASFNLQRTGLVLDYTLNGSLTSFVAQCDTTYVISNTVNFYGDPAVRFEGGAVFKFAKTNTASLVLNGTPAWQTAQYRPCIFTAVDDHTVGDKIGTNTLSGRYGGEMLYFTDLYASAENVRMSHAHTAIKAAYANLPIRHSQFVHCDTAFEATAGSITMTLENVLLYDVNTVRICTGGGAPYLTGKHLTVHQCDYFSSSEQSCPAEIWNSIIVDLADWGSLVPVKTSCHECSDCSGLFQTVGAASHYLTDNTYRNAGTTAGLGATLLDDLKKRTTYPPIVLTALCITNQDLTLTPQAQRDTDTPDLGYHYDPLDFAGTSHLVTNATITLAPGVALSVAVVNAAYGFRFGPGGRLISTGSPTNLNRIVRYNTVQEQAVADWSGGAMDFALELSQLAGTPAPFVQCRYTEFSTLDASWAHVGSSIMSDDTASFADCQFHNGKLLTGRPVFTFTNCLLDRVVFHADDNLGDYTLGLTLRNVTLRGGSATFYHDAGDAWTFRDNFLALTNIFDYSGTALDADYNGYITNATRLNTSAMNDVTNLVITFDSGPLGYFYLPTNGPATNLVNKGSQNATNASLWHFTVRTDQRKETNSIVDIGFHYIALDSNGLPVDTDGDGWPDYWEDVNGNGSLDSGETKPNDAADRGLRVFITRPKSGSSIP